MTICWSGTIISCRDFCQRGIWRGHTDAEAVSVAVLLIVVVAGVIDRHEHAAETLVEA